MEYISTNSGLLKTENVKEGDKLILIEDAYSTFSEKSQKTYWNVKVQLPDKTVKLAGLMEISCDKFAEKWGNKTEEWTGHTVQVSLKTSKAGNPYIILVPTDEPRIIISTPIIGKETIEYPVENVNSDDIPF